MCNERCENPCPKLCEVLCDASEMIYIYMKDRVRDALKKRVMDGREGPCAWHGTKARTIKDEGIFAY